MAIRAVLMDLDNTLYAYDPPDRAALARVMSLLRRELDANARRITELYRESHAHFARALRHQAGRHNRLHIFSRVIESLHGRPRPKLALAAHDLYWRTFLATMRPHPQGHRVLRQLSQRFKLALVTNQTTEVQYRKVERLRFAGYFDVILTSEQAGVEKPDPKIFRAALKALGVRASQALMLGDTIAGDIAGAQAAGLRAIQTIEFTHDRPSTTRPQATIRHLPEILDIPGLT